MTTGRLLSAVCGCVCAVMAAALLVQSPPSVCVTPGSKVSISCDITVMGGQCSQVVWLHFGQVSGLRVTPWFDSGAESQSQLCLLEIHSAALQDAGRYYCVLINGLMLLTGGGTMLTVTESLLRRPVVDLLVPSHRHSDSSLPVPLVCLASGLEDPGRVTVDWEVDGSLSDAEGGVVSVQLHVPAETWAGGAEVSCVLTDGELKVRQTVSSRTGPSTSSECVFLTATVGSVCVVLFVAVVTLSILLSHRQRGFGNGPATPSDVSTASVDLHYAALRFETSGRRNII